MEGRSQCTSIRTQGRIIPRWFLIHTPEVLLLDEPTTGVDPVSRRELWEILYDLVRRGLTLIVATPYMDEAERCHRVALLHRGKILRCETPDALRAGVRDAVWELRAPSLPRARDLVRSAGLPVRVYVTGDHLHLLTPEAVDVAAELGRRLTAEQRAHIQLRLVRPTMEDVFISLPPLLTALAVVRERERGSILQIYISPIRSWEFLGGKLLPYAGIAFLDMCLLLAVGSLWFRAPVRGSVALLLGLTLIYVLCTAGIGLLISTFTRSQVVAILLSIVLTLMPSFLFSGFIFPIASRPRMFQWYTYLFPSRYFMEIARGITLKGVGLARLWPDTVVLFAYGVILLALASLRFRKKIG